MAIHKTDNIKYSKINPATASFSIGSIVGSIPAGNSGEAI